MWACGNIRTKTWWLRIHEDASWEFVNSADEVLYDGVALADSSGVELHFDGSGDTLRLDASPDGTLLDNVNGGVLVPTDTIQSSVPFFEQKGLSSPPRPTAAAIC